MPRSFAENAWLLSRPETLAWHNPETGIMDTRVREMVSGIRVMLLQTQPKSGRSLSGRQQRIAAAQLRQIT